MPKINLLPWREELRKERQQQFYVHMFLAAAAGVVVVAYGMFTVNGMIDHQQSRNNYLQTQIQQVDQKIEEIKDLQKTRDRLLARMQVIDQLQKSRPEVVHLFDELVKTLPDGVFLTDVTQSGDKLEIKGTAESSARVSNYMRNIDKSPWLDTPNLEVIETEQSGQSRVFNFTLHTKQTQPQSDTDASDAGRKKTS